MTESNARMMSGVRELVGAEVLVVDQDARVQKGMTSLLAAASLHVTCVEGPEKAYDTLQKKFFSVCIVDLDTPTPGSGLDTTREIKQRSPTSMVIMLTPRKSFDDCVSCIRAGAVDVIFKSPEAVQYLKERVMEAAGRSVGKREVSSVLAEVRDVQDEFLDLFMKAERRALDLSDKLAGRDPNKAVIVEAMRVLVVDPDTTLADKLSAAAPDNYSFDRALSGGQALDVASTKQFHYVMVSEDVADLPSSMVVRSVKTQNPEVVALSFKGPGEGGRVDIIDSRGTTPVVADFTDPKQLVERLDELAEAFRAKSKERRYTQSFRERHYDFLRRYVELKLKIDRAIQGT